MRSWTIGSVKITQLVELVLPEGMYPGFIPDATPEALFAIPWLCPEFITAKGETTLSFHSFIIDTPAKRVMVDTCIGNGKDLPVVPAWDQMQTDFLKKMCDAGFPPESIDIVVCTHLHMDHVGWNTMLIDGMWRPTFPNARYLFGRVEYEYQHAVPADLSNDAVLRETTGTIERESVRPVLDAGLADFVEFGHHITEEISLVPTPGHTPGHVSILIRSNGAEAIITGDAAHHPCQLARPDWSTAGDVDGKLSAETRWRLFGEAALRGQLVLGTHWSGCCGGTVTRTGEGFQLHF